MARLWSARYYGVARQRAGRAKTASGTALTLSITLMRAREGADGQAEVCVATGSASPPPDRTSWLRGPRVNPISRPYARAREGADGSGLPVATGSASPRPDRTSWRRGPALTLFLAHMRARARALTAVVCPLLRGQPRPDPIAPAGGGGTR